MPSRIIRRVILASTSLLLLKAGIVSACEPLPTPTRQDAHLLPLYNGTSCSTGVARRTHSLLPDADEAGPAVNDDPVDSSSPERGATRVRDSTAANAELVDHKTSDDRRFRLRHPSGAFVLVFCCVSACDSTARHAGHCDYRADRHVVSDTGGGIPTSSPRDVARYQLKVRPVLNTLRAWRSPGDWAPESNLAPDQTALAQK